MLVVSPLSLDCQSWGEGERRRTIRSMTLGSVRHSKSAIKVSAPLDEAHRKLSIEPVKLSQQRQGGYGAVGEARVIFAPDVARECPGDGILERENVCHLINSIAQVNRGQWNGQ